MQEYGFNLSFFTQSESIDSFANVTMILEPPLVIVAVGRKRLEIEKLRPSSSQQLSHIPHKQVQEYSVETGPDPGK